MLTWEDSARIADLTPEEISALGPRAPAKDFIDFIIAPYLHEEPLKENPGIRDFICDDITAAQQRGSHDLAGLLKLGIRQRLIDQGYAGELPPTPSDRKIA